MDLAPKYAKENQLYQAFLAIKKAGSEDGLKAVYQTFRDKCLALRPQGTGTDAQKQIRVEYYNYIVAEAATAFLDTHIRVNGINGGSSYSKEKYQETHGSRK